MSAFFCSSPNIVDGIIWSSIHSGSCTNMSLPGSPGNCMCLCPHEIVRPIEYFKNASHVFGLSTASWFTPRTALNGWCKSSSNSHGGISFPSFFDNALHDAWVRISVLLHCLLRLSNQIFRLVVVPVPFMLIWCMSWISSRVVCTSHNDMYIPDPISCAVSRTAWKWEWQQSILVLTCSAELCWTCCVLRASKFDVIFIRMGFFHSFLRQSSRYNGLEVIYWVCVFGMMMCCLVCCWWPVFFANASAVVETWGYIACATQFPLCTFRGGLIVLSFDDQFTTTNIKFDWWCFV